MHNESTILNSYVKRFLYLSNNQQIESWNYQQKNTLPD
jgi:hypothetical protein